MNRIDVLYVPSDNAIVTEFIECLKSHGINVHVATTRPEVDCPLVVLITSAMLNPQATKHTELIASDYNEVLPVSFLAGPAPLFAGLSQSVVAHLGVDRCALRISTILHHGGKAIIGWNNLVADALRWQTEGRQALIPERDVAEALAMLQSGPALESERRDLVRDYVTASQHAVVRRRRIGQAVFSVTAAVLVVILVFAVVQAVNASQSRDRAQHAAHTATASRLAREAVTLIPGDPDLPTVLASRALQISPTASAQEAASRVAASTWPHTSHQLGFKPQGISAARESEHIAVVKAAQGVVVYDAPGGNKLCEFAFDDPSNSDHATVLLNPKATLLAVQLADTFAITLFDIASGKKLPTVSRAGGVRLLDWLDDEHVLLGTDTALLSVNATDGSPTKLADLPAGEVIDSASVSSMHDRIAAATDKSVLIVNLSTHSVEHRRSVKLQHPVLSADGKEVLGIDLPRPVAFQIDDDSTEPPQPQDYPAREILPIDGPYALITNGDGQISIIGSGRLFQTVRAHLTGRVWAARLNNGRFATVGSDGFVRTWDVPSASLLGVPTSAGLIDESSRMASVLGVHVDPRESARNQIRMPTEGYLAVTILPGYARVVTVDGLTTTKRWFFDGLTADLSLSQDGSHIASVGPKRSRSFRFDTSDAFWRADSSTALPGSTIPTAIGDGGKAVSAVSNDGSTILIADEYQVSLRRDGEDSDEHFDIARHPVALSPGRSSPGAVLTSDGYLRRSDGTETQLSLPDSDHASVIAAAEPRGDGAFTLVTSSGQLFTTTSGALTSMGSIGTGNGSFALRTSSDGKRVAIIGDQGLAVFDTDSGRVIFREGAPGTATVTDVVFAENNSVMYAVNQLGAVRSITMSGEQRDLQLVAPRELTTQEAVLFHVEGA